MHDGNEKDEKKSDMNEDKGTIDNAGLNMNGHIIIRDKETGEEIINKRNAIHYGNMARIVGQALNNVSEARIYYMAFGNGGTSVDTTGKIVYKTPRVSEAFESSANLYSRTFKKIVGLNTDTDKVEVITGATYTDLKITCTLGYNEPSDQELFDSSTTNEGDYIFDELSLFSYPSTPSPTDGSDPIESSNMLTHVIFHPVQKSLNRVIEVIYTVRVQLS